MHLKKLEIRNFRAITQLDIELVDGANILVGPNAVGKTTVLEAIRLAKGVLVPRTQNEATQVLVSLGVISQHLPQQINFEAIASDKAVAVEISCHFELSDREINALPYEIERLAQYIVAAQQGISLPAGYFTLIQFLSTPFGRAALAGATTVAQDNVRRIAAERRCKIALTADPRQGFRGEDSFSQVLFAVMEGALPPSKALFSYFTADRALPAGEAQIQLGAVDAQQQLESHNSTPSLKYQRLKNVIFSTMVESEESGKKQKEIFQEIFEALLKGRKIESFTVNRFGQASILIRDVSSGKVFDIDSMSSGEKGLILTFLIISKAISEDGLVLIDEPDLHLNSAVCKDLLDFLLDRFLLPLNIQAVICTHSPEIMSASLRRDDCKVFHLRRGLPVSPMRKHDQPEAIQALRLLGTSEIEELLYEATIFVEGPDDVDLLEYAFRHLLARFKFRELMGRGEVEKHIRKLQQAEAKGLKENISYFIFDLDGKPSGLSSTEKVVVKQWDRYCLENYLLDVGVIYDTVLSEGKPQKWPACLAEAELLFPGIAKSQLRSIVVDEVYSEFGYTDIRLRKQDRAEDFAQAAESIFRKIQHLKGQLDPLSEAEWKDRFEKKCKLRLNKKMTEWEDKWPELCNGKQFFQDLTHYAGSIGIDISSLKRRLIAANRDHENGGTASWKGLCAVLGDLLYRA